MFTWNTYYNETLRRNDEIAMALQDRFIRSISQQCQSRLTRVSIRMLDFMGTKLVAWGSRLQCRCAELTMARSNRAI